jgi:hypothetical protein
MANLKFISLLAVVVSSATLCACMRARTDEVREMATAVGADEGIVVLAKPQTDGAGTEGDFLDCIGDKLKSGAGGFKVHDNESFVNAMFPWFEPSTAPVRPEAVAELLSRDQISHRLQETGVRYVVWVNGVTKKTDSGGSIACGAAPGAAGCIGFGWWEKESDYQATVWDLKQSRSAGTVSADVTGTSALVGAIVPLPFIARVQGTACNRLSSQLKTFLRGEPAARPSAKTLAKPVAGQ